MVPKLSHVTGSSTLELFGMTIGDAVREAAEKWPDNEAIVSVHQSIGLSYREVYERACMMASNLFAVGLGPGGISSEGLQTHVS